MKKTRTHKLTAWALALAMLFTLAPAALAADDERAVTKNAITIEASENGTVGVQCLCVCGNLINDKAEKSKCDKKYGVSNDNCGKDNNYNCKNDKKGVDEVQEYAGRYFAYAVYLTNSEEDVNDNSGN